MITIEWLTDWLPANGLGSVGQWIDQLLNCLIASSIDWLIWLYSSLIHLFICSFIVSLTGGGGWWWWWWWWWSVSHSWMPSKDSKTWVACPAIHAVFYLRLQHLTYVFRRPLTWLSLSRPFSAGAPMLALMSRISLHLWVVLILFCWCIDDFQISYPQQFSFLLSFAFR